ncbi:DHA2 family efflux MFS transporter permease subunit [Cohnella xylanilytica]|uniref:DHA2 family efflux MFS transporter permease subunit n=1 Tax=Cohnella xylanilytica TaxID=557555 RepID=A0A841TW23_9BACL|nr:DHA2 family efflux MFS transporter permease subunit [Cohnella xylanilytica]MBB6692727.1 DHA2 family efflux MFS transporter permease subunit [Cohnella xylanilytica]
MSIQNSTASEPAAAQASAERPPSSLVRILVPLAVLIAGAFMVMFDSTAVNLVVPRLIEEFGSSYPVVQWAVTGYVLAESAVIPLTGWLCDRFGTKRISLLAIGTFTAGSLLCALAPSIETLIASRIVQGLGGGMIVPILFAFAYRISPPDRIGKIMGIVVIPILFAPALGPVLSGWIADSGSWHWIFAVNVPIGAIAIAAGIRKLPALERQPVARLDLPGMLLAPVAFAGLCYGISEGGSGWGSAKAVLGIGIGLAALVAFVAVELKKRDPLLELRVFGARGFAVNIVVLWIAVFVQFGSLFLVPQALQYARGFRPSEAGLILLPYVLFAAISNQIGGRLYDRRGIRPVALTGFGLLSVAMLLMSTVSGETSAYGIVICLIVIGASVGFCVMPLTAHLMKLSPPPLIGRVTSLSGSIQQVVVALAVSTLATLIASRFASYSGAGGASDDAWPPAFRDAFLLLAGISVAGFVLSVRIRKPTGARELGDEQEEG